MKKRIVCFGDSNTWGHDSSNLSRFDESVRWPKLLENFLGAGFEVVEEGLMGRSSTVDDPLFEGLNAMDYIYPCLMSHKPIALLIIMLGTNDTKERFNLNSFNIAQSIARLTNKAALIPAGKNDNFLRILNIIPPPIKQGYANSRYGIAMGKDCDLKSAEFPKYLKTLLREQNIEFLDTAGHVEMNNIDFMHLDGKGHKKLADLVFEKLKEMQIV